MFRQRAAFIWRFLLWSKSEINAAGAANQVYGAHAGGPHIGQFNRCLGRKLQPALHHGPGIAAIFVAWSPMRSTFPMMENMRLSAFTSDGEFSTARTLEILLDNWAL